MLNSSWESPRAPFSPQDFRDLCEGDVCYMTRMTGLDVKKIFGNVSQELVDNVVWWLAIDADGLPIFCAEDKKEVEDEIHGKDIRLMQRH